MQIRAVVVPFLAGCLLTSAAAAQEKNQVKFGKISPDDFKQTRFELDTGAHAVVLSDIGSSDFDADGGDLKLVFKRHRRVKILDKNGYEAADVQVPLYHDGKREEKLSNLKAVTYNLENGQVVETKLDGKSVFTEELNKNNRRKKFSFPAVKEGAVIEYTYTVTSPFLFSLQPWDFQDKYPCLWSEYAVGIPQVYDYIFIAQGYHKFESKTREDRTRNFHFREEEDGAYGTKTGRTENYTASWNVSTYRWIARDVPPLKDESFTTCLSNHNTRIEFQLSAIKYPNSPIKPVMGTWSKLSEDLLKHEDYGVALDKNNGFLADEVDALISGITTNEEKARQIFIYVRNNFTCTEHERLFMQTSLKSVFNAKSGNVSEINLLLVAMLRKAGLTAYPVILSTRDHGYTYPMYPMVNRFNSTIAAVSTGSGIRYLDASYPLGFGKLHASCYNGHARMLDTAATPLSFDADSLLEQKFTTVFLKQENGMLKGSFQQRPTYFESYELRNLVRAKGREEYFKPLSKAFDREVKILNSAIEDLDSLEIPVMVKYDFELLSTDEDVIYLNPMFSQATHNNPFKVKERTYPVEMSNVVDEIYTLNLEIPEGYQVEELPKSAMAKFNENDGLFQYIIAQNSNMIQFRSRIKLNKANFMPDEYGTLREFYDLIVKKQAEQIVLKKKK